MHIDFEHAFRGVVREQQSRATQTLRQNMRLVTVPRNHVLMEPGQKRRKAGRDAIRLDRHTKATAKLRFLVSSLSGWFCVFDSDSSRFRFQMFTPLTPCCGVGLVLVLAEAYLGRDSDVPTRAAGSVEGFRRGSCPLTYTACSFSSQISPPRFQESPEHSRAAPVFLS